MEYSCAIIAPLLSLEMIGVLPSKAIQTIYKGKNMNKGDLVEKVAQDCNMTKASAEQALNSVLGVITNAVAAGDKVALIGFGTFSVSERAAREGRNPKNGETIQIPAGRVVRFKAGKKLAEAVK